MNHRKTGRIRLLSLLLLLAAVLCLPASVSAAGSKNKLVNRDGYTYYYKSGKPAKNKFITLSKKTYYFDGAGHMMKGTLFSVGSKTYYAGKEGVIAKNKILTIDGKEYFFDKNGVRQTKLVTYNKQSYYFLPDGGYLKNCWKKIGNYTYHFNAKGCMDKNKWVDSAYVNANGQRISLEAPKEQADSRYHKIAMTNIRQNPQLPTGCESVALTMVLKYYGFHLSKTTIASSYLPKSGSGNFVTKFAGSPFSPNGAGIYAPGLKDTANKYLKAKKSSRRAYDLTGIDFDDLYRFVESDIPVIVWNSMYMWNPVPSFSRRALGRSWTFFRYEHCVVFCGYNKNTGKVLINDALSGLVWRSAKSFKRIYNKLGKMAVVIQ